MRFGAYGFNQRFQTEFLVASQQNLQANFRYHFNFTAQ